MSSKKHTQRPVTERRVFNLTNCEVREASDGGPAVFSGYAAVFNELSVNLGGFRERIQPGCFRNAVENAQDVRFLINHDASLLLGRTKSGTVVLIEDEVGLRVECPLPDTSYASDLIESMSRGDIDQMSFGFVTRSDEWKVKDGETGLPIRELVEADLFDVSVVTYPAYPDTTAEVRSLIEENQPELLERAQRAAEEIDAGRVLATLVTDTPETPEEEREIETTDDEAADESADLKAQFEQMRGDAGVRIEDDHAQCDGVAVVWNFNDELQSCHLTREAAEAQVEAMTSGAAGAARAGKALSKANKEKLDQAVGLLSAVLEAAGESESADEAESTLNDIVGLNDALPDLAAFRKIVEERGWSWDDDYAVWSLTQMIESASIFLCYADDDDEEDSAKAAAMKAIIVSLTELLAQAVAEGARSDEPAAEERDGETEETEETEEQDVPESRFDKERRRLKLVELEVTL